MAKAKSYYYLVDSLDTKTGEIISRGLKAISTISNVSVDYRQGVVEVISTNNPEPHVKVACEVAGTVIRTKIKKRQLY